MAKKENVQTNYETKTIVTTTKRVDAPCYMPIDTQDEGAEEFYKENGIMVKTINIFGSNRVCAIVPNPKYTEATTDEERASAIEGAKAFSNDINDYRRHRMYHDGQYYSHQGISLTRMMDAGYDPAANNIDIAIKINSKVTAQDDADKELGNDEDKHSEEKMSTTDWNENVHNKVVCRGGYDASNDFDNPEYIVAKDILYAKLHALIGELDGEELEIVKMIMDGKSEREFTEEHGIARSTFQGHKKKLLARLKKSFDR